ncbi:hypothetical protein SNEBB_010199 [Seison nebaliae]|nr:hypothetical protein SNEBB_010199 [Seison nebaliae]
MEGNKSLLILHILTVEFAEEKNNGNIGERIIVLMNGDDKLEDKSGEKDLSGIYYLKGNDDDFVAIFLNDTCVMKIGLGELRNHEENKIFAHLTDIGVIHYRSTISDEEEIHNIDIRRSEWQKAKKIYGFDVRDHRFRKIRNFSLYECVICEELIWKTGYRCLNCKYTVHQRCFDIKPCDCSGNTDNKNELIAHDFLSVTIVPQIFPRICTICGERIYGFSNQCKKCQKCRKYAHHKCTINAPFNCRTNGRYIPHFGSQLGSSLRNFNKSWKGSSKENRKKLTLSDFDAYSQIGDGGFGKVYLCKAKIAKFNFTKNQLVAIKVLPKQQIIDDDDVISCLLERNTTKLGKKNKFIISLICSFTTHDSLMLVMEFAHGGDLGKYLEMNGALGNHALKFFTIQMFLAIFFLHKQNILYRDMKPDNLFLTQEGYIKLGDFGMCKQLPDITTETDTICGTLHYMPPEIIKRENYNYTVDYWSCGTTIYQLATGAYLFNGVTKQKLKENILKQDNVKLKSDPLNDLLEKLLEKNAKKRQAYCHSEIIKHHPFLPYKLWRKIEDCGVQSPIKVKKFRLYDDDPIEIMKNPVNRSYAEQFIEFSFYE